MLRSSLLLLAALMVAEASKACLQNPHLGHCKAYQAEKQQKIPSLVEQQNTTTTTTTEPTGNGTTSEWKDVAMAIFMLPVAIWLGQWTARNTEGKEQAAADRERNRTADEIATTRAREQALLNLEPAAESEAEEKALIQQLLRTVQETQELADMRSSQQAQLCNEVCAAARAQPLSSPPAAKGEVIVVGDGDEPDTTEPVSPISSTGAGAVLDFEGRLGGLGRLYSEVSAIIQSRIPGASATWAFCQAKDIVHHHHAIAVEQQRAVDKKELKLALVAEAQRRRQAELLEKHQQHRELLEAKRRQLDEAENERRESARRSELQRDCLSLWQCILMVTILLFRSQLVALASPTLLYSAAYLSDPGNNFILRQLGSLVRLINTVVTFSVTTGCLIVGLLVASRLKELFCPRGVPVMILPVLALFWWLPSRSFMLWLVHAMLLAFVFFVTSSWLTPGGKEGGLHWVSRLCVRWLLVCVIVHLAFGGQVVRLLS